MMSQSTLPTKTEFYIFLSIVEISPEKAKLHYETPFDKVPDLYDYGVRSILERRAMELFGIPRGEASTLYDTYLRSTDRDYEGIKPVPLTAIATTGKPDRVCVDCDSRTTYIDKKGYALWYRTEDGLGFRCLRCYNAAHKKPAKKKAVTLKACKKCGSRKTYTYNGYPRWHTDPDGKGLLCHKCYSKKNHERSEKKTAKQLKLP